MSILKQSSQLLSKLNKLSLKACALAFICMAGLTACLSPVKTPHITTYTLNAHIPLYNYSPHGRTTIWVTTPTASPGYQSPAMVYRLYPYQMANFAKNRWAAPPAAMLAPLIVESLKNSGHFRAVLRTPAGVPEYRLDTQLLQLEQQFYHHPSEVVLTIQAQLINNRTHRVIFDKRITCVVAAYKNDPYDGVVAANEAAQRVLNQLTAAVVSRT